MRETIKRLVLQLFPELSGGYHLPRYAEVLAVADAPAAGDLADDFRPRYAVDLQVLNEHGAADPAVPVLYAVPLPVAVCGGAEMGQFGFPQRGTVVMLQFVYGSPNKPAITAIYPHGGAMPACANGELVTQQRSGVQQRIDAEGNMLRQTDGRVRDECQDYVREAFSSTVSLHQETVTVEGNSTRTVKGAWLNKVLGAFRLAVGGSLNLSSADNMALTTASDMNVNVARNLAQAVQNATRLKSGDSLHLESPANYIGNSSHNLFAEVSALAQAIIALANAFAAHTHLYSPGSGSPTPTAAPNNASTGTSVSTSASAAKGHVDAMTE